MQAAAARLTSVQELCLSDFLESPEKASVTAQIFAALPTQLRSLVSNGGFMFRCAARLEGLQRLRLEVLFFWEENVHQLVAWLPRLQCLELVLLSSGRPFLCDLRLLSLLPADELRLTLQDRAYQPTLTLRLTSLADVRLHTLELRCEQPLTAQQEQLLLRCQVTDRVLIRVEAVRESVTEAARQLECLPSGAVIEYKSCECVA